MGRTAQQAGIQAGDLSAMAVMNMAVNGFHNVSQENGASLMALTSGKYLTDQHVISFVNTAGSGFTAQQVANPFPSMPGIPNGLKILCSTAANPAAGDYITLYQPIEGNRAAKLAWGTALGIPLTVGWVARPSYPMVVYIGVLNGAANSRVRFARYACPANVDTFIPLRFDPEPTGVWAKDNTGGLTVYMVLQSGATSIGTPDTWLSSGSLRAGADVTNLCSAVGQNVIVSGLVMFPGIVPISKEILPLIARHVPQEEMDCKRYFETGGFDVLGYNSAQQPFGAIHPLVRKRAAGSANVSWAISYSTNLYSLTGRIVGDTSVQLYGAPSTTGGFEAAGTYTVSNRM